MSGKHGRPPLAVRPEAAFAAGREAVARFDALLHSVDDAGMILTALERLLAERGGELAMAVELMAASWQADGLEVTGSG
jgi:hypothetical protein